MLQITYQRGDDKYSNRAASMISCLHISKAETVWTKDLRISQRTPSIKHAIRILVPLIWTIQVFEYRLPLILEHIFINLSLISENHLTKFETVWERDLNFWDGYVLLQWGAWNRHFRWKKLRGQGSWTLPCTWWSYHSKQPQY